MSKRKFGLALSMVLAAGTYLEHAEQIKRKTKKVLQAVRKKILSQSQW